MRSLLSDLSSSTTSRVSSKGYRSVLHGYRQLELGVPTILRKYSGHIVVLSAGLDAGFRETISRGNQNKTCIKKHSSGSHCHGPTRCIHAASTEVSRFRLSQTFVRHNKLTTVCVLTSSMPIISFSVGCRLVVVCDLFELGI